MPSSPPTPSPRGLAAGVLVVVLCVAGIAGAAKRSPRGPADTAPRPTLKISGTVAGLYPGARKRLTLTFANRGRRRLRVLSVRVAVRSRRRGCAARQLVVGRTPRRFWVGARRRVRRSVAVRLRATAPDACKRVAFPMKVRANVRSR